MGTDVMISFMMILVSSLDGAVLLESTCSKEFDISRDSAVQLCGSYRDLIHKADLACATATENNHGSPPSVCGEYRTNFVLEMESTISESDINLSSLDSNKEVIRITHTTWTKAYSELKAFQGLWLEEFSDWEFVLDSLMNMWELNLQRITEAYAECQKSPYIGHEIYLLFQPDTAALVVGDIEEAVALEPGFREVFRHRQYDPAENRRYVVMVLFGSGVLSVAIMAMLGVFR